MNVSHCPEWTAHSMDLLCTGRTIILKYQSIRRMSSPSGHRSLSTDIPLPPYNSSSGAGLVWPSRTDLTAAISNSSSIGFPVSSLYMYLGSPPEPKIKKPPVVIPSPFMLPSIFFSFKRLPTCFIPLHNLNGFHDIPSVIEPLPNAS